MMCTIYRVHPTGVGMIRSFSNWLYSSGGSSHRRGNDSAVARARAAEQAFIPQAWEWFEAMYKRYIGRCVHPTGVGMIRRPRYLPVPDKCSSHRRGNDSDISDAGIYGSVFIPQAWEWFVPIFNTGDLHLVHPTGVGMIRGGIQLHRQINRSSHRRGNDSLSIYVIMYWQEFIPQAWEWFGRGAAERTLDGVHPTGVGMIRVQSVIACEIVGSSHRRGNDSEKRDFIYDQMTFIPQAWEWFEQIQSLTQENEVHPTGVGMIRSVRIT